MSAKLLETTTLTSGCKTWTIISDQPGWAVNRVSERTLRFGLFELNPSVAELRRLDRRIKIRPQACKVLALLASRPGEVVTRDELRQYLWPEGTFVDFEHGLNFCIRQIRRALGESAKSPRYVETIPRHGYRFALISGRALDSIAVLPFESSSGVPELEYLSDGITDGLIRQLATLPRLRVMARTTMFRFKGRTPNPVAVGRRLGTAAVLTGRVLQWDGRLQIGAELVDVATGLQLWGDQYQRVAKDVVTVQQEISAEIVSRLRVRLTSWERERFNNWRTNDPNAHHLYLKGRYFSQKWSGEGFQKGIDYFNQAIEQDPTYALAYAGLADCYGPLGFYGYLPPSESWPKAKAAAMRAVSLDEQLAEVHVSIAAVSLFYEWKWISARQECQRAIELDPNYPPAYAYDAGCLISLNEYDHAIEQMRRAQALDPLSPWLRSMTGAVLYFARRYDDAVQELREALELDPHYGEAHRFLAICLIQTGELQAAVRELEVARDLLGDKPSVLGSLGRAYGRLGMTREAEHVLSQLKSIAEKKRVAAASSAAVCVALGRHDLALEWLQRAVENRSSWMVWLNAEPWWDPLRSYERFHALLHQVGFRHCFPDVAA